MKMRLEMISEGGGGGGEGLIMMMRSHNVTRGNKLCKISRHPYPQLPGNGVTGIVTIIRPRDTPGHVLWGNSRPCHSSQPPWLTASHHTRNGTWISPPSWQESKSGLVWSQHWTWERIPSSGPSLIIFSNYRSQISPCFWLTVWQGIFLSGWLRVQKGYKKTETNTNILLPSLSCLAQDGSSSHYWWHISPISIWYLFPKR